MKIVEENVYLSFLYKKKNFSISWGLIRKLKMHLYRSFHHSVSRSISRAIFLSLTTNKNNIIPKIFPILLNCSVLDI